MNIEQFIAFVRDLVNEELYDKLYPTLPQTFLKNGGCYEFAKVLQHYFKKTQLYINKELDHCVVKKDKILYDIDGKVEDVKNYRIANNIDIDLMQQGFGRDGISSFEGKQFSEYLIQEINQCNIKIEQEPEEER